MEWCKLKCHLALLICQAIWLISIFLCHFAKSLNAFKFNHLSQMLKIESTSDFCVHWAPHLDISSCHPLPIIHWLFIKILHISYTPFSKEKICTRWPENFKIKDKHSSVKWNDINIIFKLISLETSQFFFFFQLLMLYVVIDA